MKKLVLVAVATTTIMMADGRALAQVPSPPAPAAQTGSVDPPSSATSGPLGTNPGAYRGDGSTPSEPAFPPGMTTGSSPSRVMSDSDRPLGTGDPDIDRQDRELDRKIRSICRKC